MLILAFIVGAICGSFFNVLIYRLPRKRSILVPSSHCPACRQRLNRVDLIPLLSYIVLFGSCRYCHRRISFRYPLVELISGGLFLLSYREFGLSAPLLVNLFLLSLLLVVAFIDLEHRRVPNFLVMVGLLAGVLFQLFIPRFPWTEALRGMVLGGGIFLLIIGISRGGMGAGDMKLMLVVGFFLGATDTLLVVLFSFISGGSLGALLLLSRRRGRKDYLPFAPFIASSAFIVIFWGQEILAWYMDRLRA